MDAALTSEPTRSRGLLMVGLAPVFPQIVGSTFNIWYNIEVVKPLLYTPELLQRFKDTVLFYNCFIYPLAVGAWLWVVVSLRGDFRALNLGETVEPLRLDRARRRVIHLPWLGATVSAVAWLICIPVFLGSLAAVGQPLGAQLLWHLPISFLVSAFIAITQSFFVIELRSHRELFPVFFRDVRADRLRDIHPLSLRGRGLMWAISAGVCPIVSLILLSFAPPSPTTDPVWFELFVGGVGIAFGLTLAILISRLVAEPVDQLRAATQAVADGRFEVRVPVKRADEFGALIGEFNRMAGELQEKEHLRKTFGLHVGRKAAEQILARDPGLNGTEQVITVMFVDIRGFTARTEGCSPERVVSVLNEFLRTMVHVVEEHRSGMINKFLGDGFIALFGAGIVTETHADEALHAAQAMLVHLETLNTQLAARGEAALAIGIGLHTGPAIVGSIGSPERLEFTAIGRTVNLAARIESLTKTLGETLLLTEATRAALRQAVPVRELPAQMVRGVDDPVRVFGPAE